MSFGRPLKNMEMIQTPEGLMQVRIRNIVLTKKVEGEEPIEY